MRRKRTVPPHGRGGPFLPFIDLDPIDAEFRRKFSGVVHLADPTTFQLVGKDHVEGKLRPGELICQGVDPGVGKALLPIGKEAEAVLVDLDAVDVPSVRVHGDGRVVGRDRVIHIQGVARVDGLVDERIRIQMLHQVHLGVFLFRETAVRHQPKGGPEAAGRIEPGLDFKLGERERDLPAALDSSGDEPCRVRRTAVVDLAQQDQFTVLDVGQAFPQGHHVVPVIRSEADPGPGRSVDCGPVEIFRPDERPAGRGSLAAEKADGC